MSLKTGNEEDEDTDRARSAAEKIQSKREALEELADSDLPVSKYVETLLEVADEND